MEEGRKTNSEELQMQDAATVFKIVTVTLTCLMTPASAADSAHIEVRPGEETGPVNRLIFGNNMVAYQYGTWRAARPDYSDRGAGIWDPDRRRPVPEYVKLARQAGLSVSRWPGGCGTHNYHWKLTVGPLEKRPKQKFGLPEFLTFCEQTASVPILTVAVYWGTAADAADLVEYLNGPNDGSIPNGGTDWAAIRAGDGHAEPYNVVWFEYGNESNHGEHRPTEGRTEKRKVPADEYARSCLKYQSAMKAVDPHVKQANFYVYQLYHQHFGDMLITSRVSCGHWDFPGGAGVPARSGEPATFHLKKANLLPADCRWKLGNNPHVGQHTEGQTVVAEFSGQDTNYYHAQVVLPAKRSTGYRVTGEIKTVGLETTRGVGFQVGDARGWLATKSATNAGDVRGDTDWTPVVIDYVTLADTTTIQIVARRQALDQGGNHPITGRAYYRLKKVQESDPPTPVRCLTCPSTRPSAPTGASP